MRGQVAAAAARIYSNALDRTCVGLTRSGTFSYKVQSGARYVRVCDTDRITVVERTGNGFNCGLGMFGRSPQKRPPSYSRRIPPSRSQRSRRSRQI